MEIRDATANAIVRTYTRHAGAASEGGATRSASAPQGRSRTDIVTLSPATQELRRLRDAAAEQSDVRADRIAVLKTAIAAGAYQVDTVTLAERMLSHA
jgi:flagellar biosynthesis anti-sigma factor FlgM